MLLQLIILEILRTRRPLVKHRSKLRTEDKNSAKLMKRSLEAHSLIESKNHPSMILNERNPLA